MSQAETQGNQFAPLPPLRDSSGRTAQEFADELFVFEYCSECSGDIQDHWFVVGPDGGWFAFCKREEGTKGGLIMGDRASKRRRL